VPTPPAGGKALGGNSKFPFLARPNAARVIAVVSEPSSSRTSHRRLSDLTAAHAADRTLENLLRTLTAKIDVCARLPVFEYEADSEGHHDAAEAFQQLALHERRAFEDLLRCLRAYLDEVPAARREGEE
jgi:hypothetical protein